MGKYLQQQYEKADTIKALSKLELMLNEEHKKLSDRVKELTLSHKRMRKLLILSKNFIEMIYLSSIVPYENAEALYKRLYLELYGLEDYKTLDELMKGGK